VIVLSASAPKMDIPTFIRTLRTRPESALVPVLFIGEQTPVEEQIQGFQLGSDDFPPPARWTRATSSCAIALAQQASPEGGDYAPPQADSIRPTSPPRAS
jgi:CheY-like chemotaxis protein